MKESSTNRRLRKDYQPDHQIVDRFEIEDQTLDRWQALWLGSYPARCYNPVMSVGWV